MITNNTRKLANEHKDHSVVEKKQKSDIISSEIEKIRSAYQTQTDVEKNLKDILEDDETERVFFLDVSCFLSKTNFESTLNFLNHPDFKLKNSNHKIGIENKNLSLLHALMETEISQTQNEYLNEILKFYFPGTKSVNKTRINWIRSEPYRKQLQKLFSFKIFASDLINRQDSEVDRAENSASKSIFNSIKKIAKLAEKTRTFFLGLGNRFGKIIKKLYEHAIVLPHTKKIEWFANRKLGTKIFFGITIPAEIFTLTDSLKDAIMKRLSESIPEELANSLRDHLIQRFLDFFAYANQSLRDLIASVDLVAISSFIISLIIPILDHLIEGGLGGIALFLIFNSVEELKGIYHYIKEMKKRSSIKKDKS